MELVVVHGAAVDIILTGVNLIVIGKANALYDITEDVLEYDGTFDARECFGGIVFEGDADRKVIAISFIGVVFRIKL
ncbi:hypothetical protein D3C81_2026920 [compost metagenome]